MNKQNVNDGEKSPNSYYEMRAMMNKMALGTVVSATVYPCINLKNKIMGRQKFNPWDLRGYFKGITPFAASYVPTAFVAMTVNGALLADDASDIQKMVVASLSGAVSGVFCTVQENLAQNMDKPSSPGAREVAQKAINTGGYRSLFRGGFAISARETLFASGYLAITPIVCRHVSVFFPDKPLVADAVSATVVGVVVGTVTTPIDLWRFEKQKDVVSGKSAESYRTIIKKNAVSKIGWKGAFRGVSGRSMASSIAIFFMNQGIKYIDNHTEKKSSSYRQ